MSTRYRPSVVSITPVSRTLAMVNLFPVGSTTSNGLNPSSTMTVFFMSKNLVSVAASVLVPAKLMGLVFSEAAPMGFNPVFLAAKVSAVMGSPVTDLDMSIPAAVLASVGVVSKPPFTSAARIPIPGAVELTMGTLAASAAVATGIIGLPVAVFSPVTVVLAVAATSTASLPSLESSNIFPSMVSSLIILGLSTE